MQVNGQHSPWPQWPLGEMAACVMQPVAAPVVGSMAFVSCSDRIYQLFSYQTWWISSPTPFPALALHWEIRSTTQHWGVSKKERSSPWFCLPRLWNFSKLLPFPDFTFPREERPQEIMSVKSTGKKTVMRYRSNPQKRWERLILQWALPKGNQPTVNNASGKRRQTFNPFCASTVCAGKPWLSLKPGKVCFSMLPSSPVPGSPEIPLFC